MSKSELKSTKQPFIPRNRPKSWVIGVICIISVLILLGPLYFLLGDIPVISTLLYVLINATMVVGFFSSAFATFGYFTGVYKNIEYTDWANQVW